MATLAVPLLAMLPGWMRSGTGGGRVALHVGLLACGAMLLRRGVVLRRRGETRQALLALGLLAGTTLPYAAILVATAYLFVFAGTRF